MELFNQIVDFNADPATASEEDVFAVREALESLVIMLAPFAPHVAAEMWEALGHAGDSDSDKRQAAFACDHVAGRV